MGTSANENIAIVVTSSYDATGTAAAKKDLGALGDAGKKAQGALAELSKNNVNVQIGAFEQLGKKIDVTNAAAVQGYRAQGDALASNLIKLGATDAELNKVGAAIAKVERAAGASMLDPKSPQAQQIQQLPQKTRTAANAIGILGQAAVTGGGSMAGLAVAVGNVAEGLANVSKNAKIAAGASVIGLLVTLGAAVGGAIGGFKDKTKDLNNELARLQSTGRGLGDTLAGDDLKAKLEGINQSADDEIKKLKDIGLLERATDALFGEHARQRAAQIDQINANREKSITLIKTQEANEAAARAAERNAQITIGRAGLALDLERVAARRNDLQLSLQANDNALQQRKQEIEQSFIRRSASGAEIQLTKEEAAQKKILVDLAEAQARAAGEVLRNENILAVRAAEASRLQGSDNLGDRFRGRMEEIELARVAEIQAIGDVYGATLNAEQKIRALRRETAKQASSDAKTIFDAFRSSSNASLKAIGTFGENLRRIAIGAEAARAAVRSAVEFGEAIASFAVGDFAGGALHSAAGLQLGAAAALGFRESLGGGGGGAAAGGGGGGGLGFKPKEGGGGGGDNVTIILQTVDPYNGENIRRVSYHLNRQGVLKTPIYVPATIGLVGAVS